MQLPRSSEPRPKTKIIATIGPSTWDKEILSKMYDLGMTGARINASFADFEELDRVSSMIRSVSDDIALILDTHGHKLRLNKFDGVVELVEGSTVEIGNKKGKSKLWIDCKEIFEKVEVGNKVLIDNGSFELSVEKIGDGILGCKVVSGGMLTSAKTVNLPDTKLDFPTLTEKDIRDIEYAVAKGFDYISASFIRTSKDVEAIREYVMGSRTKLIAKIENQEGLDNFQEIMEEVDGIMVARGDLGVETNLSKIPVIQKEMILKCRESGKMVIVATHMMESMIQKSIPTRAEISDVANAVFDGTDAVMLSAETTIGKYPVETVKWMASACVEAENSCQSQVLFGQTDASVFTDSIARSVIDLTDELPIDSIVVGTKTGNSVVSISRHRPGPEIIAFVNNGMLRRQLNLVYGVKPVFVSEKFPSDRDWLVRVLAEYGVKYGLLKPENTVVLITGSGIAGKARNTIVEVAKVFDICNV